MTGDELSALLRDNKWPVVYWHDENDGPPTVAIVNIDWLGEVWEAATGDGGYVDPRLTEDGQRERFMPHTHSTPEDRAPSTEVVAVDPDGRTWWTWS